MINKPMTAVAAVVAIAAVGSFVYLRLHRPVPPAVVAPSAPAAEVALEPVIEHPLPPAPAATAAASGPLPTLNESDASLMKALAQVSGDDAVKSFLMPENLVRHLVVTIDNLPRSKVAFDKRPTLPLNGVLAVNGDELHATLDDDNFERYRPLVAVIDRLDMRQLMAVYVHFYPLFQQAYQDLGYPTGYFNDRLVQVIDVLLAAPQPAGPIELTRPNVMYTFADPALEAAPAGQKLMVRMGPDNERAVKAKLMELRALVTAAPLKH